MQCSKTACICSRAFLNCPFHLTKRRVYRGDGGARGWGSVGFSHRARPSRWSRIEAWLVGHKVYKDLGQVREMATHQGALPFLPDFISSRIRNKKDVTEKLREAKARARRRVLIARSIRFSCTGAGECAGGRERRQKLACIRLPAGFAGLPPFPTHLQLS